MFLRVVSPLCFTAGLSAATPPVVITLQLPADQRLHFCAIPLAIGDGPFAGLEFTIGGRGSGGFRENQMQVRIGGAVVLPVEGKPDWHLLFGQHEVTRAQWAAVLGEPAPPAAEASLPVVGITRAQVAVFLEKANKWLHQDPAASGLSIALPAATAVFLRLPDEAEWEFAARGGHATMSDGRFDKRTPYTDAVNLHEWYAGAESSNGRLRAVGKLAPNPLGLHDMLGNAGEIAEGIYRVEYVQGRSGGLVIRGGSFRTPLQDLRSSHRTEVPLCQENGDPYRSDGTGFRLVLGSPVMPSGVSISSLEEDWGKYAMKRVIHQPSLPADAPLVQQTAAESGQVSKLLDEISSALALSQTPGETIEAKIGQIRPQLTSIQARINEGQQYFAKASVSLASVISHQAMQMQMRRSILLESPGGGGVSMKIYDEKLRVFKDKMTESANVARQIGTKLVAEAFDEKIRQLNSDAGANEDYALQSQCTRAAKALVLDFAQGRGLHLDSWESSINEIAQAERKKNEAR